MSSAIRRDAVAAPPRPRWPTVTKVRRTRPLEASRRRVVGVVDSTAVRGLFTRSIRPPDDVTPNPNPPGVAAPGTVGPPNVRPGRPGRDRDRSRRSATTHRRRRSIPSAWSGWPADWVPVWGGHHQSLTDTAWMCLDLNTQALSTMPPYLVDARRQPERRLAAQPGAGHLHLLGGIREAAVLGLPARRGVRDRDRVLLDRLAGPLLRRPAVDGRGRLAPGQGLRRYKIGGLDVTDRHAAHPLPVDG